MPHAVLQFPPGIYPAEVEAECPEAAAAIAVLIMELEKQGPSPDGYRFKNLGKRKSYLWQINLKGEGRQVRILYAPYKKKIVIFRIHKKSSPQEQQHAYDLAVARKRQYDQLIDAEERASHGTRTIN